VTVARICALPSRAFARYRRAHLRVTVTVSKIVKNENQQIKNRRAHLRVTVSKLSKMKIVKIKNRRAHLRVTVARICALPSRAFARYRYRIKNRQK
jgi:hypothetical protein